LYTSFFSLYYITGWRLCQTFVLNNLEKGLDKNICLVYIINIWTNVLILLEEEEKMACGKRTLGRILCLLFLKIFFSIALWALKIGGYEND